ncbi:non-reducing end alpha-L-arabinofuranosidase [Trifolium repens]|nr:non-reducing end alpha-L-arabinofuranosidase [Trifolium repens]
MFSNAHVFDKTPRNGPKAFVSEYALVGARQAKNGTLLGAFSEAGFLIGLETNIDHVVMACYAPLFVNANDRKWNPDAISKLQTTNHNSVAASAILWQNPQNNNTYLKIKIANIGHNHVNLKISIKGFKSKYLTESTKSVLTSKHGMDENSFSHPKKIIPQQSLLQNPGNEMNVIIPPISLTVFDMLR